MLLALAVLAVTPHVSVTTGPVNGVTITAHGKRLAVYGGSGKVDRVLFTHHVRDVTWAGRGLAEAVIPAAEEPLFQSVGAFWEKRRTARFHDYAMETARPAAEPLHTARTVRGGDVIDWEGLKIQVLDTPGYTRGAVSYLFEIDGKRIACVGDLIMGDGRIPDLYSLQDAIADPKEDGYHGYGARAAQLIASLNAIAARKPDLLIPARGPVIRDPQAAVARLVTRMQKVFASHFEIDALRWYRGDDRLRGMAARILGPAKVDWMPSGAVREKLPDWLVAIANSRVIVSADGGALLVDCGNARIAAQAQKYKVEGIWVSHYHDDHTNYVQAAAEAFHCPVYATRELQHILEHPEAYSMPAQTSNAIRPVTVWPEGEKRRWHEFELTPFYYPGQTLYHDGLLVKKDGGESVFFAGDSFTPSGIDDYCLLNRNLLSPEKGYAYCLRLLKRLNPDYVVNQHVPPLFHFSMAQIDAMIANVERRKTLMADLFPWDDPNFGLDHRWARFSPYAVEAAPGQTVQLEFVILNHSPKAQQFRVTPNVPTGWKAPAFILAPIGAHQEGSLKFRIVAPPDAKGTSVITASVAFGAHDLREWAEAIVTVR